MTPKQEVNFFKELIEAATVFKNPINYKGRSEKNIWLTAGNQILSYLKNSKFLSEFDRQRAEELIFCKAVEVGRPPERQKLLTNFESAPDIAIEIDGHKYAIEYVKVTTTHDIEIAVGKGVVYAQSHNRTLVVLCDVSKYKQLSRDIANSAAAPYQMLRKKLVEDQIFIEPLREKRNQN